MNNKKRKLLQTLWTIPKNLIIVMKKRRQWKKKDLPVRIYYIYYLIRSNAADGQRTADG
jgi:hypothetical protein